MNDRRHRLLSPLALLALVGSIVVAVPVAAAQTAGIDQYQPNPGNDGGSGGAGGGDGPGPGAGAEGPSGATAPGGGTEASDGDASGGGSRAAGDDDDRSGGAAPTSAGPAEGDLGDIPFTDYPMTPLLLAVILLLAAGLIARVATLAARRYRDSSPAP